MTPLLSLLLLAVSAESASILAFFPVPFPSHHFIFRPVLEGLAQRGHSILYVTGYPYKETPKNIDQIVLSFNMSDRGNDRDFLKLTEKTVPETIHDMYTISEMMASYSLGSKEVQQLIHSDQKFDAVMFESYFYQEFVSAFIHKFNAIGIEVMSLGDNAWVNELSGLPDNPAYQLDFKADLSNDMTFFQKIYNVYVTGVTTVLSYYYLHYLVRPAMDKYFNYTGWENRPSIDVLARNRSLILTNFDYLFGFPYPTAPHRKDIGGINIKPNEPLPKDLQSFMDGSEEGVIYMSLGSHIDPSLLNDQMSSFLEVFKELPQKVLMKYELQDESKIPPNVKLSKWFPQQDILAHKKCILFITHGGLLSLSEATYHGVPLVGIPILADQAKNLAFVESQGFGRMLKLSNVTKETVSWAVREILNNSRYREEALRRSKILKDRRHTPVEEAVYWVEHTLKYPFALTPKSTSLSAVELHLIDVKFFIISVLLAVMYIIYSIFTSVRTFLCNSKRGNKLKAH